MQQQQPYGQPYGRYPYYGPPVYPPQTPYSGNGVPAGPSSGYPPFYGPPNPQPVPPSHNRPSAPTAYSFDAEYYGTRPNQQQQQTPHSKRNRRTWTGASILASEKPQNPSVMKKTLNFFNQNQEGNPLARVPSNPAPPQPTPRQRTLSNPARVQAVNPDDQIDSPPFHMLVSFHGYNELRIENVVRLALDELRRTIWILWPPGVESDQVIGHQCVVRFKQTPWDLSNPNAKDTYKLLVAFFQLFQTRGYSFQATVNTTGQVPRLVFRITQPDPGVVFFLAYFSQENRKLTLIDPPAHIEFSIGARLRSALPKKALSDTVVEEYTRVIELKRAPGTNLPEVDPIMFYVEVLRVLTHLGFELDATVCLSRRSALGMRAPRELLLFKGGLTTPTV